MTIQRITPDALITDLAAEDLPLNAVSTLTNMRARDGKLQQARPFESAFGTLIFQPRYIIPNNTQTVAYMLYCGFTGIGVSDGTTQTDLTPLDFIAPTVKNPFNGGVINQLPVVNAGNLPPWYWDQSIASNLVTLPGWPAGDTCKVIRPFREFLIAMNIRTGGVTFPDLLRWSDAAAPGTVPQRWDVDTDTQAGEVSVSFNPGELVDGRQLVDRFILYKTSSAYLLQYVAGAFIFNQRPIFSTVGLLAPECVVEYKGRHFCLTDGDVIAHDGTNVQSIVDTKIRKQIFGDLDGDNFENSYLSLDKENGILYVCRPKTGETYPSEAFAINLADLRASHQQLVTTGTPHMIQGLTPAFQGAAVGDTWDTITTTWDTEAGRWNDAAFQRTADNMVLADFTAGLIHQMDQGATQAGDPINTELRRDGMLLDMQNRKFVRRLWLSVTGVTGAELFVSLGATDAPDGQPQFAPEQSFIVGSSQFVSPNGVEGRYLAYRIRTTGQVNWRLNSLRLEFEPGGEF